ncbi:MULTISPECIES: hypothetical protein [Salinibaculum]|uniref:hypothetical protein n=1 Tax=Salinibaculum TaxID=2732368 RepID=UPI0030D2E81D
MRLLWLALVGLVPLVVVGVLTTLVEVNLLTTLSGAIGATVPAVMIYVVMTAESDADAAE